MPAQIFFRLPFSKEINFNNLKSDAQKIQFTSFDGLGKLKFNGSIESISEDQLLKDPWQSSKLDFVSNDLLGESEESYIKKISDVIAFIKENEIPKLVISRRKIIDLETSEINLFQSLLNLIKSYDNAFSYVFKTNHECWIGAFSEVLGKFNKKTLTFETMSLAGTLPLNENWTDKEIEEQKIVSLYVESVLLKHASQVEKFETEDHISGNIKHLKMRFQATVARENLENLISELHPTPAVCGIPKDFCRKTILDIEKKTREFYAGYSTVETQDEIFYFVNLRCAKIYNNAVELFLGGGITEQSNPKKEWQETELKAEAVLKNLDIISY